MNQHTQLFQKNIHISSTLPLHSETVSAKSTSVGKLAHFPDWFSPQRATRTPSSALIPAPRALTLQMLPPFLLFVCAIVNHSSAIHHTECQSRPWWTSSRDFPFGFCMSGKIRGKTLGSFPKMNWRISFATVDAFRNNRLTQWGCQKHTTCPQFAFRYDYSGWEWMRLTGACIT